MKTLSSLVVAILMLLGLPCNANTNKENSANMIDTIKTDHYTFELSDKVTRQKVTFKNRYGITLTGELYIPKNAESEPLPSLAISGPFGAVRELSSGLYANQRAGRGFVAVAFIPSSTG